MLNREPANFRRNQTNNDEAVNLRALAIRYAAYWPLFAVCVVVALAGAYIYSKYETPAYEIMATLMIKDSNEQPTEQKSSLVEFQALEQVNAPKVVENEIEVLKSNQLIKNVVNYFQLWADYKLKGGIIKNKDLYGINPVKIVLAGTDVAVPSRKIDLRILDSNRYVVLDKQGKTSVHGFGDTVNDKESSWAIIKNGNINHYIGNEIQISVTDPEQTILGYQNALKVEAQEKPATVLNISLNDANVKKAEDFINYLIYFYKQADIAEKSKITKSTLEFIDNRLDSLSGQLNHAENNIEGYRSQNGLTDINAQSQMYLQGIQSNGEKLNEINVQLSIIDKLEAYVDESGNTDTNIPSTVGISDQHLSELIQKLSDVTLERNKMLATLPEKNPAFEPVDNQISSLKQSIKEDIKSIKSSLLTMQQSLESFKSNIQSSIKSVPVQEHQLAGMGRQQSTKSSLYDYLLQQREAISLTYASSASEVRLVDAAHTLPLKATKKFMPFGIAFLLGLILPAGFVYSRDVVRNTVSNRHEIESLTGLPVIAEFSLVKLPNEIVLDNKNNRDSFVLIEQFRHLRTQLNSLNSGGVKGFSTIITSAVANEGKSFVCGNLAASLANTGRKTILFEMDIYQPKVSKALGLQPGPGITDFLAGKAKKSDIINKSPGYPDLDIVASGNFIDNFAELLDQETFANLLTELKTQYDHILFDASPIHSINDAYLIARHCDASLFVVRHNFTSKSLLPFIKKLSDNSQLPGMNIVFNGLAGGRDGEGFKYQNYYRP